TVEADPRRLVEALFEADMGAERAVVIVRPGNGIGTVKDHLCLSLSAALECGFVAGARLVDLRALGNLRHGDIPPETTTIRYRIRIGIDDDYGRYRGITGFCQRGL